MNLKDLRLFALNFHYNEGSHFPGGWVNYYQEHKGKFNPFFLEKIKRESED